jgi:hypothetical protein
MTRDEIIKMARDSGMELYGLGKDRAKFVHYLEAFANLVAQHEREVCAKVADYYSMHDQDTPADIADAIRARNK